MNYYKIIGKEGIRYVIEEKQITTIYFFKQDEKSLICSIEKTDNINKFVERAKMFGYEVEPLDEKRFYEEVLDELEVQSKIIDDEYYMLKKKRGDE